MYLIINNNEFYNTTYFIEIDDDLYQKFEKKQFCKLACRLLECSTGKPKVIGITSDIIWEEKFSKWAVYSLSSLIKEELTKLFNLLVLTFERRDAKYTCTEEYEFSNYFKENTDFLKHVIDSESLKEYYNKDKIKFLLDGLK